MSLHTSQNSYIIRSTPFHSPSKPLFFTLLYHHHALPPPDTPPHNSHSPPIPPRHNHVSHPPQNQNQNRQPRHQRLVRRPGSPHLYFLPKSKPKPETILDLPHHLRFLRQTNHLLGLLLPRPPNLDTAPAHPQHHADPVEHEPRRVGAVRDVPGRRVLYVFLRGGWRGDWGRAV